MKPCEVASPPRRARRNSFSHWFSRLAISSPLAGAAPADCLAAVMARSLTNALAAVKGDALRGLHRLWEGAAIAVIPVLREGGNRDGVCTGAPSAPPLRPSGRVNSVGCAPT